MDLGIGELLLIFGIVVLLLFGAALLTRFGSTLARTVEGKSRPTDAAVTILRERYARGEITKQQYEDMKRDLT